MIIKYLGVMAAATALAFVSVDAQCQTSGQDVVGAAQRENDARQTQILKAGVQLLKEHRPAEAIQNYFDKVIASYEAMYPPDTKIIYCARSAPESLSYLAQAAKDDKTSLVIGPAWCDAYFLRAYGLIDLGRNAEARQSLEKAIGMSPKNAHYVSELASVYRIEKNWKEALAKYETAAQLARDFSPPESRVIELGEALRGKGYVLVELGRFDEAEATYKQCLEINPADKVAIGELGYVQSHRKQGKS
jgi:tetratricopeptide (TPR) repeat protein